MRRLAALIRRDPWIAGALLCAVGLRLTRLGAAQLWLDEVLTARWVAMPWDALVRTAVTDNHPPLYFALLKLWTLIAGDSAFALRLPSAVLSAAVVALVALLALRLAGRRAARSAAWLAALSPYLLHYGQEARMYALVSALAAWLTLEAVRVVRAPGARPGVGFALAAAALATTHYYGTFVVLALAAVLWQLAARRGQRDAMRAGLVPAVGAALVALAVAALFARRQAGGGYDLGLVALPGALWSLLAGPELLPAAAAVHAHGAYAALPYVPLALLGTLAFVWLACAGVRALLPRGRGVLVGALGGALAAPFVVQLVVDVDVHPRYLAAALPLVLVVLAAGMPARLGRDPGSIAAVALLGLLALGSVLHLARPGHGREDIAAIEAWLATHAPSDPLLVTSSEMAIVAGYYWPERPMQLYPPGGMVATRANADALAAALPLSSDGRAVYVFGRAWVSDPEGALRAALRTRYASCGETTGSGVEVFCLRAARAARGEAVP